MKIIFTTIIILFALALEAQQQWVSYNQVNAVTDIAFDSLNNKWVATGFGGLAKLTGNTWSVFDTLNSNIPSNRVWSVAIDKKNILWISTNKGIGRYDGFNWTKYDTNTLLFVNAMAVDNQNIKWMTSFNHGLIKYNDTIWTYYKTDNSGIQTNSLTGIGLENNIKWVATGFNGLIQYNDTNFINYNTTNSGITSNNLRCVSVDQNGDKWIGFDLSFAVRFNSRTNLWTYYNEIWPGLTSGNITFVYNDSRNVKWFGGLDALYRFNDTILVNCNPPVIGSGAFGEFKEDKHKNVWICGDGLYVYNPNGIVFVGNNNTNITKEFMVYQNYPNPFNNETNIRYEIPQNGNVSVSLFDVLGRNISIVLSENKNAGLYNLRLSFDKYSSGIYFLKFNYNNKSITKRIVLMK